MTTLYFQTINSPIGLLHIAHANDTVFALEFAEFQERFMGNLQKRHTSPITFQPAPNAQIEENLAKYFAGDINALNLIQTSTDGTPFQQEVWQGLRGIPAGETASYQQLAHKIGHKNGQRAVGAANGRNPIPLIIPCHRVINSNGKLGGYSGALWRKEWLLKHEGVVWVR